MKRRKKAAPNDKVQPRLSPLMHSYLTDLVDTRLYGDTKTEVAKKLIEDGVRRAIADRHIEVRRVAKKRGAANNPSTDGTPGGEQQR
jgi:hypothetical protein